MRAQSNSHNYFRELFKTTLKGPEDLINKKRCSHETVAYLVVNLNFKFRFQNQLIVFFLSTNSNHSHLRWKIESRSFTHKFENGPTQIGTIGLNRLKDKRQRKSRIYVTLINLYFTNGRHFEWRAGLSRAIVKRDNLSQICIKLIQRFQKRRYSNIIVFKKCLIYKISINLKRELPNIYYSAHFDVPAVDFVL